jgi:hypothetical protein
MVLKRITKHPILEIPESKEVAFTWNGKKLTGYEGEMISAALCFAPMVNVPNAWSSPMVCRSNRV